MQLEINEDMLACYSTQSKISNPGTYAFLYDSLPESVEDISSTLQNILLHTWKVEAHGLQLNQQRRAEIEIRPISRLLERIQNIDARSWGEIRPLDSRVVVDCRHFATLLCSILRHKGIPARTRHGFASYLESTHSQAHVICEYWDASADRWVATDPDTARFDLSGDQFITADAAWRGVHSGSLDAAQFGYAPDLCGAWCIRWEFVRDFAALNKQEMLTFDIWGINANYDYNAALLPQDAALLNHIAALLQDNRAHFKALRDIYDTHEGLRVPTTISSQPYTTGIMHTIDLKLDGSL
jgi:Transglutaminase-like superfamily